MKIFSKDTYPKIHRSWWMFISVNTYTDNRAKYKYRYFETKSLSIISIWKGYYVLEAAFRRGKKEGKSRYRDDIKREKQTTESLRGGCLYCEAV